RDLVHNLSQPVGGARVLLLGAGGAARGALLPLLDEHPASLLIANRTVARAEELVARFSAHAVVTEFGCCEFSGLAGRQFDLVINATAASLSDQVPPLPKDIYAPQALAYDMMYGSGDTPFLAAARKDGAARLADGLGMLVEQAAES